MPISDGFDAQAARKAGYSDDEILSHLTASRKFDVDGAIKSGYSKPELIDYLSKTKPVTAPSDLGNQVLAQQGLSAAPPSTPSVNMQYDTGGIEHLPAKAKAFASALPWTWKAMAEQAPTPVRGAQLAGQLIRNEAQSINVPAGQKPGFLKGGPLVVAGVPTGVTADLIPNEAMYRDVVAPAGEGSAEFIEGQYQPQNLATLGAFSALGSAGPVARTVQRGAGAYFGGTMAKDAYEQGKQAIEANNTPEAVKSGVHALFSGGMALGVGRDLAKGRKGTVQDLKDTASSTAKAIPAIIPAGAREAAANRLRESAKKQYERVIVPTTKQNKNITARVVPELLERGVIATSPEGLAKKAAKNIGTAGDKVAEIWENLPEGTKAEVKPIIEHLDAYKAGFQNRVEITPQEAARLSSDKSTQSSVEALEGPNGEKKFYRVIDVDADAVSAINQLRDMVGAHGDTVSAENLRKIRDIFEKKVAKAGGFAGIIPSEGSKIDAADELGKIAREQISKFDPNMRKANQEYAFWKNVERVAKATAERRVGQQGGLKKIIYGAAGATVGSAAGPHGTIAGLEAGKIASKIGSSALLNTTSAVVKNKVANAISPKRGRAPFLPPGSEAQALPSPTTPVLPPFMQQQVLPPPTREAVVGTQAAANRDTALFQQARQTLGEGASVSQVAQRAQELKKNGTQEQSDASVGVQPLRRGEPAVSSGKRVEPRTARPEVGEFYHGTHAENIEAIRKGGFIASEDGTAGSGVYLSPDKTGVLYERNPELSAAVKKHGRQPDTAVPVRVNGKLYDAGTFGAKDGPDVYLKPHVFAAHKLYGDSVEFAEKMNNAPSLLKAKGYVGVQWRFADGRKAAVVFDPKDVRAQEMGDGASVSEVARKAQEMKAQEASPEQPVSQSATPVASKESALADLKRSYSMSESDVRKVVEDAGATYNGIWDASASKNGLQVQVTDKNTGMTITLPVKDLTPDYVRGAIDARRQQFQAEAEKAKSASPKAKGAVVSEKVAAPKKSDSAKFSDEDRVFLHGTEHDFEQFSAAGRGHGAIYFSEKKPNGRRTQAEAIAEGPFGGNLVEARIVGGKKFDPLNDPTARKIAEQVVGENNKKFNRPIWQIHYTDAPQIIAEAKKYGYNRFRFWEDSVNDWSEAVTDPSLVKIVKKTKVERKGGK